MSIMICTFDLRWHVWHCYCKKSLATKWILAVSTTFFTSAVSTSWLLPSASLLRKNSLRSAVKYLLSNDRRSSHQWHKTQLEPLTMFGSLHGQNVKQEAAIFPILITTALYSVSTSFKLKSATIERRDDYDSPVPPPPPEHSRAHTLPRSPNFDLLPGETANKKKDLISGRARWWWLLKLICSTGNKMRLFNQSY